jgi:hypothetical protein
MLDNKNVISTDTKHRFLFAVILRIRGIQENYYVGFSPNIIRSNEKAILRMIRITIMSFNKVSLDLN